MLFSMESASESIPWNKAVQRGEHDSMTRPIMVEMTALQILKNANYSFSQSQKKKTDNAVYQCSIQYIVVFSMIVFVEKYFFETGSHCVSLAGPELTMQIKLASNTQRSVCLCLSRARIKDIWQHTQPENIFIFSIHKK